MKKLCFRAVVGHWGEDLAAKHLSDSGCEVVKRNFRVRGGELDIVAWDKSEKTPVLCFFEVKTRNGEDGEAERATSGKKMHFIFRAARAFCFKNNIDMERVPIRFEQISVYCRKKENKIVLRRAVIPVD